jgi:hypothetical protein
MRSSLQNHCPTHINCVRQELRQEQSQEKHLTPEGVKGQQSPQGPFAIRELRNLTPGGVKNSRGGYDMNPN